MPEDDWEAYGGDQDADEPDGMHDDGEDEWSVVSFAKKHRSETVFG